MAVSNSEKGLKTGTKAPMIDTVDVHGNKINLAEILQENRGLLIDFFRGAWWHYWKKQLKKLNNNISEIDVRNVKFVSIGTDKARPIKKLADKEDYKFSIVADEQAKISKEYNVFGKPVDYKMIKFELAIPSTFLIDRSGTIVWRYIGTKTDRPKIQEILEAIDTHLQN